MRDTEQDKLAVEIWDGPSSGWGKPGWRHLIIFFALIFLGTILGSLSSLSFRITTAINPKGPAYGVNYFWLGIVVQQVGSIWYGAWGILAGVIFPFISNLSTQASLLITSAYIPANFVQSFFPAFVFRQLRLNPKLEEGRDFLYLFLSMLISSLFGALWSVFILVIVFGRLERSDALINFFGWFGGNLVAGTIFNYFLLKVLSPLIIRSGGFVRRWWV